MGRTSLGKAAKAVSPAKITRSSSAKKATVKALKLPGPRRILQSLALARLVRFLRTITSFAGVRAVPFVALILGGWLFRRLRRR
jgi:hypothetical protein